MWELRETMNASERTVACRSTQHNEHLKILLDRGFIILVTVWKQCSHGIACPEYTHVDR